MTRRVRRIAMLLGAIAVVIGAWLIVRRSPASPGSRATTAEIPPEMRAPAGARIRVEVLNATHTRGLGRRATMHLRDRGYDVVFTGTAREQRDSTLVLDRTGHPEWAALVAKAIGDATVEARPDSSRYVDVTVLIGASWRAPAEPFYP
jgi:hypothetical protein